jgi:hypothetical protein
LPKYAPRGPSSKFAFTELHEDSHPAGCGCLSAAR